MNLKKMFALILAVMVFATILPVSVNAFEDVLSEEFDVIGTVVADVPISSFDASDGEIHITATRLSGTEWIPARSVSPGDVIRVTVSMADVQNMETANLSLHFNPEILRVSDSSGNILPNMFSNTAFLTPGFAVSGAPGSWGNASNIVVGGTHSYPYFRNDTGVVAVQFYNSGGANVIQRQEFYSIYFVSVAQVGGGDTDLRLSKWEDSDSRPNFANYFDIGLYNNFDRNQGPFYYRIAGSNRVPEPVVFTPDLVVTSDMPTVFTTAFRHGTTENELVLRPELNVTNMVSGVPVVTYHPDNTFTVRVYVKNFEGIRNISIPLLFNLPPGANRGILLNHDDNTPVTDVGATNRFITLNPDLELFHDAAIYPGIDLTNNFLMLLIEVPLMATPTQSLPLNGEETFIASFRFAAVSEGVFLHDFAKQVPSIDRPFGIYDPEAPMGATLVDRNHADQYAPAIRFAPNSPPNSLEEIVMPFYINPPRDDGNGQQIVTLQVNRNDLPWAHLESGKTFTLRRLGNDADVILLNPGTATGSYAAVVPAGTWRIFDGPVDTGQTVMVSNATVHAVLDYYTINFSTTHTSPITSSSASATYNGVAIANGATVLGGGTLIVTASATAPSGTTINYAWGGTASGTLQTYTRTVNAAVVAICTITGAQQDTHLATLQINRNNAPWNNSDSGKSFTLVNSTNPSETHLMTPGTGNTFTANVPNGTWRILDGTTDTNETIVIADAPASRTLDYFLVQFSTSHTAPVTSSSATATYRGVAITSGTTVLGGGQLIITATASAPTGTTISYLWSGLGTNAQTTTSITINNLDSEVNALCTITGTQASAVVTLRKNGEVWTDSGKALMLQGPGAPTPMNSNNGIFTANVSDGEWGILVNGAAIGQTIVVTDGSGSRVLDYYTVEFSITDDPLGTTSGSTIAASYNGTPLLPDVVNIVLGGHTLTIVVSASPGTSGQGPYLSWSGTVSGDLAFISIADLNERVEAHAFVTDRERHLATVNVNRDGNPWPNSGKNLTLRLNGAIVPLTPGTDNSFTAQVPNGTWRIYEDGVDTGETIVINDAPNSVTLNYFTVIFEVRDTGLAGTGSSTISATYRGVAISSGTVVLGGGNLVITTVGRTVTNRTFAWSRGDNSITVSGNSATFTVQNLNGFVHAICTVNGSTGGGGGGGGGWNPLPTTSEFIVNHIDRATGAIIHTQRTVAVAIGSTQRGYAINLEGFLLAEGQPTQRSIVISAVAANNVVEFLYDRAVGRPMLNRVDHSRYIMGYPDGTIRPAGNITREEVAMIFFRLLTRESRAMFRTETTSFIDVPYDHNDPWSLEAIATMERAGIVTGYYDGTFNPRGYITRAEFATIAMRFENLNESAVHSLTDIAGHWAEVAISASVARGWIVGYPDSTFRPNQPITRVETMALINRVLDRQVDSIGLDPALMIHWPDLPRTHWGFYDVQEATVSHTFERRSGYFIMENWTGAGVDIDFSRD